VRGADLVILCTPIGAYGGVMAQIAGALEPGAILPTSVRSSST
jgi:cyclohexadieny/prephenate dehydrogenase